MDTYKPYGDVQRTDSTMDMMSNPFVPRVHFELIRIRDLVSSQEYQRSLSPQHIAKAVADFDLNQINPVKVSRRLGVNYVFNGQHTVEIVAEKSGSRDTPVWCMIYDDLSYEHEADIFANQQKYVKSLSPLEIFQANLEAKNNTQLMIRDIVQSYGLKIAKTASSGNVNAVTTLEQIYNKYGFHTLDHVLRLCVITWQGEKGSLSSNILNAIAKLLVTYGDSLRDDLFKERIGEIPLKQLIRNAKERRPGAMGYAEAIVIAYNGKKKSPSARLSMQKLYVSDKVYITGINPVDEEELAVFDSTDESQYELDELDSDTEEEQEEEDDDYLPFAQHPEEAAWAGIK